MALNDPIITLAEVRQYRDVDSSYDSTRFAGFLRGVQDQDLRELLGDALWYDMFITDFAAPYDVLIDGESYEYNNETIYYPGLKPFLIWSWLSKLPLEGNNHHTQSGDVAYLRDVTQAPSAKIMNQVKEEYKRNAAIEANKIIQYLNQKRSTYPLWDSKDKKNESSYQFEII